MTLSPSAGSHRIHTRPAFQAGLVAFVVGLLAQWWSHQYHLVFAFWDSQAHLDIARRLVDSTTPGIQMLGTVWLPIPHLLLLPFTLIDQWWRNGAAGGAVGLFAYVAIVASVHDLLVRRTGSLALAWIGTILVLLNPSLLYLQTTAMTEPVLLAFITTSIVALDRWNESGSSRTLLTAGVLAALAVGSRYDGWFFVAIAVPVVAWLSWRQQRSWISNTLRFAVPSAIMAALWFGYNYAYFGDPLEFQRGVWSAQSQQAVLAARGLLPTKGAPLLAIGYYLGATVLASGALLTCLGLIATPFQFRRLTRNAPALLLLTALPFNILALWGGQSVIALPWTTPAGILNVRYGVMLLPGLAAMLAMTLSAAREWRPGWARGTLLAGMLVVLAQATLFARDWPANAGALREGLAIRDGDRRQQRASDWLAEHYDGGRVLVDGAVNLSPRTRIPLRDRIYDWTWQLGQAALAAPDREVDWVIVDGQDSTDAVSRAIARRPDFASKFDRAFADGGLEIWRRR
ncbi:MAG: phospholipid carrier-dependent glycosyltransferase [Gemmatimonadales bacterium]